MSDVLVQVLGIDATAAMLTKVGEAYKPDAIFEEGSAILLNRIRTRFRDGVAPDGTPWLESQAAKERKRKGIGNKTLFDTGTLFHSIQASRNSDGFSISTDVPYAKQHQEGIGQAKRVFLGFNSEDAEVFKRLVLNRIEKAQHG